ncbi:MAG: hypothetical protein RI894_2028, partial [Bacteroidota bacterium]
MICTNSLNVSKNIRFYSALALFLMANLMSYAQTKDSSRAPQSYM